MEQPNWVFTTSNDPSFVRIDIGSHQVHLLRLTRQPAHDGKDEETASCSNADVLFLSSMEVALRAFRVGQ